MFRAVRLSDIGGALHAPMSRKPSLSSTLRSMTNKLATIHTWCKRVSVVR